jgi:hypothetical protein
MTSATAVGGFVGQDQCIQTSGNKYYSNCYANTVMLGEGTKKGFCGERVEDCTSTQTGCVWNKELSGVDGDTLLPTESGLEDKYMRLAQTFLDLSWSQTIWNLIDGSYPYLKWE